MLKISACIEMLFRDLDFYDRFEAAKNAGLSAVEFWGYNGKDLDKIKEKCDKFNIKVAAFCIGIESQNPFASAFGSKKLLYKDSAEPFIAAVKDTIPAAKKLNVNTLIVTVGQERNDATRYEQHTNIVLALKAAAPFAEEAGMTIVVEPLNTLTDHKGYYLPSSYEAFGIIEEVGSRNIKLLYDVYHQQISEGNLIPTITKNIDLIGHFHVADVPGRHEPGTGEICYKNIFSKIDSLPYDKYIGLEYSPTGDSKESIHKVLELL